MRIRLLLAYLFVSLLVGGCTQDERVTKLAEQLRRIDSDTKVGINAQDYASRLRDLNFAAGEVERAEVGSDEFRKEAGEAVSLYKDAGVLWAGKIGTHNTWIYKTPPWLEDGEPPIWWPSGGVPRDQEERVANVGAILLERKLFVEEKRCKMDEAMSLLWQMAKEHSDKALAEVKD